MNKRCFLPVIVALFLLFPGRPVHPERAVSSQAGLDYLAPGTHGVKHLCLIYHGQERRLPWTKEHFRPYAAWLDNENIPRDWLFDSFLFIEFATDTGKQLYYYAPDKGVPDGTDWVWLAEAWFRPETGLIGLEQCIQELGIALCDSDHKVNVVIALPVPLHQITHFDNLPGTEQPLNFSLEEHRRQALEWYIKEVCTRFDAAQYNHLNLLGFYWTGESITSEQHETVRWTAQRLHGKHLKFFWIPYFTASGVEHWKELGFDAMMLQPNYFFEGDGGLNRLMMAAKRSRQVGSGVEMEFDGRAFTSREHEERFWDYLDAGGDLWLDGQGHAGLV